ncbi:MAG TPA: UDP-N-acetylmuramoyl-L-alanyl-D-glutamate--2,6-diaminopimelate ligase [Planctomycetota bacterium]|nr:UDP-N-acetylmuramoyl-L-alanyl-D-glutamate--2,6-diaminopimelate ligase [Planctomycetota bacterium]HRU52347.1 UDP-N-acetylmuramoyl-L-alanyl-D-glutamate--2,6-diaminopimelate ligase [Planctomycetota bacterium]
MNLSTTLQKIQEQFPQIQWKNENNVLITNLQNDSRKATNHTLFIALDGTETNGAKYIEDAIQRGAVAILSNKKHPISQEDIPYGIVEDPRTLMAYLSDWFYQEPTKNMHISAVTGTNGKTTTTFMLESIQRQAGYTTAILGTTGYYYGGKRHPASHTTPDALILNELFYNIKQTNTTHIAMEVSSHALMQQRVVHIKFDTAMFTNLSRDHLDYHKTMENYRDAKAILFQNLSSTADAILNADDPASEYYANHTNAKITTYSMQHKNAIIYAHDIRTTSLGFEYTITAPNGQYTIQLPIPGPYNISNSLAAISAAYTQNISWQDIQQGIKNMSPVPGRLEKLAINKPFSVYIDYAHTDQALQLALESLRNFKPNKIHVVFGCGGDRDKGKRSLMGKVASQLADFVYITNDNPRTENPESIIQDILQGVTVHAFIQPDRKQAIHQALDNAQENDVVLIAGKGHEDYQILGTTKYPFSDHEVVLSYINK